MQIMPVTNTNFKGSMAQTEKGASYYKTNNGLKIGAIYGGLGVISSILPHTGESKFYGLIGLGLHSGIGAFMDYKRNRNAAKAADYIQQYGVKRALATRDDIEISENNRAYYKSNVGGKYGTIIGAAIGALIGLVPSSIAIVGASSALNGRQKSTVAGVSLLFTLMSTGIMALGGFIMGKITDYFTNRAAARNA